MKHIVIFGLLLILVGCGTTPVSTSETTNPQVTVGVLFLIDGCTTYRFSDAGRFNYFTKCKNASTQASFTVSCGKFCTEQASIPTITE